jgi:hypothetical protein
MVTLITCLQNSGRVEWIERSFTLSFVDFIRSSNRTTHCSPVLDTRLSTLRKTHEVWKRGFVICVNLVHAQRYRQGTSSTSMAGTACPVSMLMCVGLWIPTCLSKFNVICDGWHVMTCLHTPLYMYMQCEEAW